MRRPETPPRALSNMCACLGAEMLKGHIIEHFASQVHTHHKVFQETFYDPGSGPNLSLHHEPAETPYNRIDLLFELSK